MKLYFNLLSVFIAAFCIDSCNTPNAAGIEKIESSYPGGQPEIVFTYSEKDSVKIAEKYLYEDGKTKAEGEIKSELRNGTWFSYYENGNKWSMNTYKKGVLHGPYQTWHENGQLYQDGQLENGKPTGVWRFYNNSGVLVKEHDCTVQPLPWNAPATQ